MNVTLSWYQLADNASHVRFVRERDPGPQPRHRLWYVRLGRHGLTLRVWRP